MKKLRTISLISIIILSLTNYVHADELPAKVDGQYMYDLTDSMKSDDTLHIEDLSSRLHDKAMVNFYIVLVEDIEDLDLYKENIISNWDLESGKNILYLMNMVDDSMRSSIYTSPEVNVGNVMAIQSTHNLAHTDGVKEFKKGNPSAGTVYSYNQLYKFFGAYYRVEGIVFDDLQVQASNIGYIIAVVALSAIALFIFFYFVADSKFFKARVTAVGKAKLK